MATPKSPVPPEVSFTKKALFVAGMLITGSINTLAKRAQNQSSAPGLDGVDKKFSKPWLQTLVMFTGEALVLLFFFAMKCAERCSREENDFSINDTEKDEVEPLVIKEVARPQKVGWTAPFWLLLPAGFDLLGTTLGGIGLLYMDASVWQMLRGSIIVFTTILSVLFLKQKKFMYHWVGVSVTVVGLALVGTASVLSAKSNKVGFGLILVVAGQFMSASQMVVEELFLKNKGFEPAQVVGFEGCWGIVLMSCFVLPILYHVHGDDYGNSYENALDGLHQIENSTILFAMVLLYLFSIAFYNFFGLSVARALSSVHRTLIDALRTTVVWLIDLFIYYVISKDFGESWNNYSVLQLFGFALLFVGTLIYNHVLQFKRLDPAPKL